ncbi:DUF6457 domain-containing protein [Arthrobacter sedimenti]|uniref:DUF6457 domain-containing protein n=1 Tax=Arthrobacter sedimenti TaxID=2694931 RepID=UPI000B359126|nr:DUF6457 domain-containing protein [Arthrobacter sedimenti]OUM41157.1 hypothetical protein B8W73_12515 [Arthrobacter agilis]
MATPDDEERTLSEWSRTLTQALQILDLEVDHPRIVELAERSSSLVSPHAGAISAFLVGYAAGTVTTESREETSAAVEKAANTVTTIITKDEETQHEKGWTGSAQ